MDINMLTHDSDGQYGYPYSRTLTWDTETMLGVLVEDSWGGGDVEGQCYRPYIYHLTPDLVRSAIAAWDDDCTVRDAVSDWQSWWYDNCGNPRLSGEHCTRRYYGDPEEALIQYIAQEAKKTVSEIVNHA